MITAPLLKKLTSQRNDATPVSPLLTMFIHISLSY